MRTIAVMNQKGGVGKTTTAVNLSAALAAAGCRVGLIDMDAQAHASLHLGVEVENGRPTVYDLLTGDASLDEIWQQPCQDLRLAPSHIDLAAAEVELAGVVGREIVLREKLASSAAEFDFVLIDCPPSLGILTLNALTAADDIYLPLQPHFLALHGLSKLLQTVELVATRLNPRLVLAGVVLCMYESGTAKSLMEGRTHFSHAHPPQYSSGGSPFLRPIGVSIRAPFQRRVRLSCLGLRSPSPLRDVAH